MNTRGLTIGAANILPGVALIPAFTVLLSLVFAIQVLLQYRTRRKIYQLTWGCALLFWAIAAFPEFTAALSSWSEVGYRAYYLFGALLLVPWLSLGTAELLTSGPVRLSYQAFVTIVTVLSIVAAVGMQLHTAHLATSQAPSNCAVYCTTESGYGGLNVLALVLAIVGNTVGTIVLAGGAALSAFRAFGGHAPRNIAVGNVLILAGALVVASASTLTRFGVYELFYAGQALGIAVIFAGFYAINNSVRVARPSPA